MPKQPHVVWVCQWYPHDGDPYAGDFIQRHAKAAAQFLPITTFSCFSHTSNKIETQTTGLFTEHIIYFKPKKTGVAIIDKLLLWSRWYWLLKQQLQIHFQENGKPDLLHCHIILNTGWLGLWAKKKHQIPYLVTEHWSGYMPGAINGFAAYNRFSKRLFHQILSGAALVTGVSDALIQVLQQLHPQATYQRLPNVVDAAIFTPALQSKNSQNTFRLLHISTFSAQKNLENMFEAFDALVTKYATAEFHIVGPQAKLAGKWPDKKFGPAYHFHGEMPQPELSRLMQSCQACVLFSHYETFGCVIIEANAVGLPVVVSDIPVLREIVTQGVNGILVSPGNPAALQLALEDVINQNTIFDASAIAQNALKLYSFETVGKQICDLYRAATAAKE